MFRIITILFWLRKLVDLSWSRINSYLNIFTMCSKKKKNQENDSVEFIFDIWKFKCLQNKYELFLTNPDI